MMAKKIARPANTALSVAVKPGIIVLAVTAYWAADNQPGVFDIATTCIWLMSAVVIGLVAYAIISVAMPAGVIALAYARRTARQIRQANINDVSGR